MDANPITRRDEDGIALLTVEGEHDIYTAPTLRERLEDAVGAGHPVVVDLTPATFVDSSILGALLDARRRAQEGDIGFVVVAGPDVEPGVQRILEITGLVSVLPVVEGRDAALDAVRRGPQAADA